jgi:hypothetical protein
MMGRFSKRSIGACTAVLAVGLLAGGCDWVQLAGNTQLNGDNAADTAITPSNVSTLAPQFTASDGSTGAVTPQAVVNGILYVSDANGLEAYSATGSTGCSGSPTSCTPLWSYPGVSVPSSGGVAVVNGKLYVTTATALEAFDAASQTNCAGTPTTCTPLWHATLASPSAPTVSNGTVFVTASDTLDVFDASGVTNCSGGVCAPVWTASDVFGDVAVSAGVAYVAGGGGVVAIDASGTKDCSGTPKVCTPLWSYPLPEVTFPGGQPEQFSVSGYPVISGTTLYVDMFAGLGPDIQGGMEGFDANGATNCGGTPIVCTPLWTGEAASPLPPLVANGVAIAGFSSGNPFAAFKNGGVQWLSSGQGKPVAIGGSVVYAEDSVHVYAYDVSGSAGCSAGTCSPLWSAPETDAIVANGTVYVSTTNVSGAGEIVAYGLP